MNWREGVEREMERWKDRLELGEGKKQVFWRQENRGSGKTDIGGRSVVWRNGSIELGEAEERGEREMEENQRVEVQ